MTDTNSDFETHLKEAMAKPQNVGELADADAVGTVGNSDCGEMLRMWIKYREDKGRKVIDKATFQSFGCETAIAVASLATEVIRGKTRDEVLNLKGEQLAPELGPLPPMKIHCAELVEKALRSALNKGNSEGVALAPVPVGSTSGQSKTLADSIKGAGQSDKSVKLVFLDKSDSA